MSAEELELGPVDVVVIGYPAGTTPTGEAVQLFIDLVERGIIRVLDVLMVRKDLDGTVAGIALADIDGDGGRSARARLDGRADLLREHVGGVVR